MKNLTLVIPAKEEKESLPQVLNELKKYKLKKIVVLEKKDIHTIKSIRNHSCTVLFQRKKGYGAALIQGIKKVKTKYFCIFNADGSFQPKELRTMMNKIKNEKLDLIFGSRYEKGAGSDDDTLITLGLIQEPIEWLLYSSFSVILALVHLYTLFMIVPIFNSMLRIDKEVIEAAYDSGANQFQIIKNVIIPLSKPGIIIG